MIEDFDGPDPAPKRRVHMQVVSIALAVAAFVGYAAASSPELQGPFAEPNASATPSVSVTNPPLPSAVFIIFDPAGIAEPPGTTRGICWAPAAVLQRTVYIGGQTVTVTTPISSAQPTCPPRPLAPRP